MAIVFPPLETASPEGLLAIGGSLDVETLLTAYSQGIFPWPISSNSPLTWFSPDPRGIIKVSDFHLSKSFHKFLKKNPYQVTFNRSFEDVLKMCATTLRKHETGTWITNDIIEGYTNLFNAGHAYSVEVYYENELVGGLYGVCIGDYFSGESMFHTMTSASKVALYSIIALLAKNKIHWIDTQMVTPIISSFGGSNISRSSFLTMLHQNISSKRTRDEIFAFNFSELNQLYPFDI